VPLPYSESANEQMWCSDRLLYVGARLGATVSAVCIYLSLVTQPLALSTTPYSGSMTPGN